MTREQSAKILAFVAVGMWSTVAVAFKIGLRQLHYIHFLWVSLAAALVVLAVALFITGQWRLLQHLPAREWGRAALGGLINPFLYYLLLFKAYAVLPAQIAQALNYTWPIMLVLLSAPLLRQPLQANKLWGLALGFVGVYFIASQGQVWPPQAAEPWGVFIALASSVVWALYWLLNVRSQTPAILKLFINFLCGLLLVSPLAYMQPWPQQADMLSLGAAVYAGVFEMGLTFIVWLAALQRSTRTDQISHYVYLSPFLSLIFIRLVLHETIYWTTLVGLSLIIMSILGDAYLAKRKKKQKK